MPHEQPALDLTILNGFAQSLAEIEDVREVKSLRDKAEAARQYIENARLGQSLQNFAAELKLRAERRIGEILRELAPHGGNRRPSRRRADLTLADLGIDSSQSSRWRREAAVPDAHFEQYLATANELGQDITAQGLLRLAQTVKNGGKRRSHNAPASRASIRDGEAKQDPISELLAEMANHRDLLAGILAPICEGRRDLPLPLSQRRVIARLLVEIEGLIHRLKQIW